MHMTRLIFFIAPLFYLCLLHSGAASGVEIQAFTGVIVLDAEGNQITDGSPSQQVRYEAIFTLAAPGIAIVFGRVTGDGWSENLNPRLRIGFMGTYNVTWESKIPLFARGNAKVDITVYVPFLRQLLTRTAFFTIIPIDADYVGSDSCKTCHSSIYDSWLNTKHATTVGCEACHGPGSAHIATLSPDKIILDSSSDVCKQCHLRNNGGVIEAENGFIVFQQQFNEYTSTRLGKYLQCATCHDPHYSIDLARKQAVKLSCRTCHFLKTIGLGMQFVKCESCHMPPAVKKYASTGIGPYRKGDMASHIWRIKPAAQPPQMFFGPAVVKDAKGPFLTLDFACLSCHNGLDSRLYDFASVQQTSTLVH